MKFTSRLLTRGFIAALLIFTFLSACAPVPSSSSPALRQQLETILRQQQEQAEQLKTLQEQLSQLHPGSGAPKAIMTLPSSLPTALPSATAKAVKPTTADTAEITAMAGSASTYLEAFSNLAAGRYAPAEAGFNLFLRDYPEHQYAPNARYWLANAQVAQNNLQPAISNLRHILISANGQSKAPAAMVLLAQIYRQQDWNNEADEILEQLRSRYPDSPEAQHFYQSDKPQ